MAVPMANYLIKTLQVSEFRNTNIIGDADKWDGSGGLKNLTLKMPITNVGLIGDYSSVNDLVVNRQSK
jgi:hypothetical protein